MGVRDKEARSTDRLSACEKWGVNWLRAPIPLTLKRLGWCCAIRRGPLRDATHEDDCHTRKPPRVHRKP